LIKITLALGTWPRVKLTSAAKDPGWIVNPILFILVASLTALFVAAILYQILGAR
jgi:hypothetical protein